MLSSSRPSLGSKHATREPWAGGRSGGCCLAPPASSCVSQRDTYLPHGHPEVPVRVQSATVGEFSLSHLDDRAAVVDGAGHG